MESERKTEIRVHVSLCGQFIFIEFIRKRDLIGNTTTWNFQAQSSIFILDTDNSIAAHNVAPNILNPNAYAHTLTHIYK